MDKSSVQNRNQIIRERTHSTVLIKKIDMKLRTRIKRATHEENLTPTDMSMLMKVKNKMSLFLWLHIQ